VEAIVRIDVLPATNQEFAVIELGGGSGGILLQTFGNGAWGLHRSGVAITSDPNPVLVGQTQHLAAVLNEGSWQLWVDGELAASFADAGYNPATGIRIGAGDAGAGVNRRVNGVIDQVRVFDYTGTFDILLPIPGERLLTPAPFVGVPDLSGTRTLGSRAFRRRHRVPATRICLHNTGILRNRNVTRVGWRFLFKCAT